MAQRKSRCFGIIVQGSVWGIRTTKPRSGLSQQKAYTKCAFVLFNTEDHRQSKTGGLLYNHETVQAFLFIA